MSVVTDGLHNLPDDFKITADVVSVGTAVGALAGWLPAIAALLTIFWTGLRIYEWFESREQRKKAENKGVSRDE